ncbi:MAG TPA: sorbosone dehydrogenase family protein, partial [Novosphingobium sp.]|nr:sorbosone dehydrogenase family protein [Novosphingobium sp.]
MSLLRKILIGLLVFVVVVAIALWIVTRPDTSDLNLAQLSGPHPTLADPEPETIPTIVTADPVGWKANEAPRAARGLQVTRFAQGLTHPRAIYTLPNGDVLVAETNSQPRPAKGIEGFVMKTLMKKVGASVPSPDRIQLLRDSDGDGRADAKFRLVGGLKSPMGMAYRETADGTWLIVANTDAVLAFPYKLGETTLTGEPVKLMDLPGDGNHWARNLLLSPDGAKLYVAVGSASNIAEKGIAKEAGRAAIHEYDFATKSHRLFAQGLRNPNGMDWNPASGELWTVVNERDQLGSDLVPDYLTSVPFGAHFGWPWVYWKDNLDNRVKAPQPDYVLNYVRKPDYALGSHVAPLGMVFARGGNLMGPGLSNGAFVARHGSWNRSPLSGYDVVFVPFDARGNVSTVKPVPILGGFLAKPDGPAHGRPTWLGWAKDGALLVSDDVGGVIWRVVSPGARPSAAIEA